MWSLWLSRLKRASYPTVLGGKIFIFTKENTSFSGEAATVIFPEKSTHFIPKNWNPSAKYH
jgi:hypothetical protein